jgi:hypothetical protein
MTAMNVKALFKKHLKELSDTTLWGDAREESFYPARHFGPVPEAAWAYRIGGYQVWEKWLKDRQDRRLGLDNIRTYCGIRNRPTLYVSLEEHNGP